VGTSSQRDADNRPDWRCATSVITISAIKADIGGYVGHSAVAPELLDEAQGRVCAAVKEGLLVDGNVNSSRRSAS
jgi:fructose 1,6-bisphosphatase